MSHRRISHVLIAAGALATAAMLFLFFVYGPLAAVQCREEYRTAEPAAERLFWPGLCWLMALGLTYCAAMYRYFRIVINIGRNRSFTMDNVRGLGVIAVLLGAAAVLLLLTYPIAWLISGLSLGPAPWLALTLGAAASGAMGMLAWALGKLLLRAVQLKEENDLTV